MIYNLIYFTIVSVRRRLRRQQLLFLQHPWYYWFRSLCPTAGTPFSKKNRLVPILHTLLIFFPLDVMNNIAIARKFSGSSSRTVSHLSHWYAYRWTYSVSTILFDIQRDDYKRISYVLKFCFARKVCLSLSYTQVTFFFFFFFTALHWRWRTAQGSRESYVCIVSILIRLNINTSILSLASIDDLIGIA
jgi:hypothetical protein